jgi:hypothetical protein
MGVTSLLIFKSLKNKFKVAGLVACFAKAFSA